MKKFVVFVLCAALVAASVSGDDLNVLSTITNHSANVRAFSAGAISRADIDRILTAGMRAPSASNRQPWYFTVVQNPALAAKIVANMPDGNALIVVSARNGSDAAVALDCGLAVESMYLAAQAMGLASRIYTGPIAAVNSGLKGELELPAGYSAVALVRVGRMAAGVDAVSAASSRRALNTMTTYK
jgi:nitroreductase